MEDFTSSVGAVSKLHELIVGSNNPFLSAIILAAMMFFFKSGGFSMFKKGRDKKLLDDEVTKLKAELEAARNHEVELAAEITTLKSINASQKEDAEFVRSALDRELESNAVSRSVIEGLERTSKGVKERCNACKIKKLAVEKKVARLSATVREKNKELKAAALKYDVLLKERTTK